MESGVIDVHDLDFGYPGGEFRLRLSGFRVAAGESVAVTGASGCGKPTLVHLLAGILEPRRGRVAVAGLDMTSLADEDRRDLRALRIGLVFQELELLDYLDVLDNVLLPYRLTPVLELDDDARSRALELLARVGLEDKVRRPPGRLPAAPSP